MTRARVFFLPSSPFSTVLPLPIIGFLFSLINFVCSSSGNILMTMDPYYQLHKLQPSLSSPRVHFCLQPVHDDVEMMMQAQHKSAFKAPEKRNATSPEGSKQVRFQAGNMNQNLAGLQRSKSLSAADVLARQAVGATDNAAELGPFPAELQATIFKAVQGKGILNKVAGVFFCGQNSKKNRNKVTKIQKNIEQKGEMIKLK